MPTILFIFAMFFSLTIVKFPLTAISLQEKINQENQWLYEQKEQQWQKEQMLSQEKNRELQRRKIENRRLQNKREE